VNLRLDSASWVQKLHAWTSMKSETEKQQQLLKKTEEQQPIINAT
jgi:hypothetical protein